MEASFGPACAVAALLCAPLCLFQQVLFRVIPSVFQPLVSFPAPGPLGSCSLEAAPLWLRSGLAGTARSRGGTGKSSLLLAAGMRSSEEGRN